MLFICKPYFVLFRIFSGNHVSVISSTYLEDLVIFFNFTKLKIIITTLFFYINETKRYIKVSHNRLYMSIQFSIQQKM